MQNRGKQLFFRTIKVLLEPVMHRIINGMPSAIGTGDMENNKEKVNPSESLNELLTRAYDAEQGYQVASEAADNETLKEWFSRNSAQRRDFGHSMKSHLSDLQVDPDKGASIEGKIHQAFMKIRSALSANCDLALIEECHRGEETAMLDYKAALENESLRTDAKKTLRKQGEVVLEQLTLLDSIKAALQTD